MRGERPPKMTSKQPWNGSSPHARGTRHFAAPVVGQARFIPACAGNAPFRCPGRRSGSVHPRMRGERRISGCSRCRTVGSSPHARGTLRCCSRGCDERRFIPACAGNAGSRCLSWVWPAVHPRMRGERNILPLVHRCAIGSSPHARGTLPRLRFVCVSYRFIPACAGNAYWSP